MRTWVFREKKKTRFGSFLICLLLITLLFTSVASFATLDFVEAATYGVVNSEGGLNVRSGPGLYYDRIGGLGDGTSVTILSTEGSWYKIEYGSGTGYVASDYVYISTGSGSSSGSTSSSASFEKSIAAFPDSYKPYLRVLHSKYPNWKFVAQNTGLNWSDVLYEETHPVYINLVPSKWENYYKSNSPSAFNGSGSHIVFDSGGYVAASEAAVAYYLDPRNFLNENSIFQFYSMRYDSATQTIAGVNNVIAGSFMSRPLPENTYPSYAHLLMDAGKQSGANPLTLASMIIQEQGYYGNTDSISGLVPGYLGYYNFFNIGAYAAAGNSAITNGLIYAKAQGWNTRAKAIIDGSIYFAKNYIQAGQTTLYLKKFNVMNGLSNVGVHQYMTAVYGANSEGIQLKAGYKNMLNQAITFEIPIYNNMPASASPVPSLATSSSSSSSSSSGSTGSGSSSSSSSSGTSSSSVASSGSTITIAENRIAGLSLYQTSQESANKLKAILGVSKFNSIILATGANYLDALTSTYIASIKNAPVILVNNNNLAESVSYVKNNLASGGTVYIVGGPAVIRSSMESYFAGIKCKRLFGNSAYDTNISVLKECNVSTQDILVCSSKSHFDALSASAVGKPILLVGDRLTQDQINYLKTLKTANFYIIGGEKAVAPSIANELSKFGKVSRVFGTTEYDTSLAVAKKFYPGTNKNLVVAYARTYYDGISGGPLAAKLKAPLILISSSNTSAAKTYVKSAGVKTLTVMGGNVVLPASVIQQIIK